MIDWQIQLCALAWLTQAIRCYLISSHLKFTWRATHLCTRFIWMTLSLSGQHPYSGQSEHCFYLQLPFCAQETKNIIIRHTCKWEMWLMSIYNVYMYDMCVKMYNVLYLYLIKKTILLVNWHTFSGLPIMPRRMCCASSDRADCSNYPSVWTWTMLREVAMRRSIQPLIIKIKASF